MNPFIQNYILNQQVLWILITILTFWVWLLVSILNAIKNKLFKKKGLPQKTIANIPEKTSEDVFHSQQRVYPKLPSASVGVNDNKTKTEAKLNGI